MRDDHFTVEHLQTLLIRDFPLTILEYGGFIHHVFLQPGLIYKGLLMCC
jgi:hypothetical protein